MFVKFIHTVICGTASINKLNINCLRFKLIKARKYSRFFGYPTETDPILTSTLMFLTTKQKKSVSLGITKLKCKIASSIVKLYPAKINTLKLIYYKCDIYRDDQWIANK